MLSMTAAVEAYRLEDLRAPVGLEGGDAHLRHDLEEPLVRASGSSVLGGGRVRAGRRPVTARARTVSKRQVGVYRRRAEAEEAGRGRGPRAPRPVSTRRPVCIRMPSRTRRWCTAESASRTGMATERASTPAVAEDEDAAALVERLDCLARSAAPRPLPARAALPSVGYRRDSVCGWNMPWDLMAASRAICRW